VLRARNGCTQAGQRQALAAEIHRAEADG
jgi:hypothetical protein